MSKAKNKNKEASNLPAVVPVEQRIKNFEAAVIEAVKSHQVGIRPYMDKYGPKIEYVDLVELAKADEAKA